MTPERRRVFQGMRRPAGAVPPRRRPAAPQPQVPPPMPPQRAARRPMTGGSSGYTAPLQPPARQQQARRPKTIKFVWLLVLLLLMLLVAAPAWYFMARQKDDAKPAGNNAGQNYGGAQSPDTIRFLATGDFIAHDSVNAAAQKGNSYDYLRLMDDFPALFKKADIRFCNDPILNGGQALGITGYPNFNSPAEFVSDMGRLGCNLANTASNHSFDFTQKHIDASVDAWDEVPNMLAVAGQNRSASERDTVHYFTIKGVKFAFLAYTTYLNNPAANDYGVNKFSEAFAARQIAEAKQGGAQFIVVSMRWGTEYSAVVNAQQKSAAQFLADQGVQLVLGHGPHVLQSVDRLAGAGGTETTVWYSLGNFLNSQIPPETLFNGVAVMDINAKTKQISALRYLPIYMRYEWTAAQARAEDTNARTNLKLYLLEDATQAMLDAQQLDTTISEQRQRIGATLGENGLTIPLITANQY